MRLHRVILDYKGDLVCLGYIARTFFRIIQVVSIQSSNCSISFVEEANNKKLYSECIFFFSIFRKNNYNWYNSNVKLTIETELIINFKVFTSRVTGQK